MFRLTEQLFSVGKKVSSRKWALTIPGSRDWHRDTFLPQLFFGDSGSHLHSRPGGHGA